MIDVSKIKAGVKVKLPDGAEGEVKGSYLSTGGIVLRVQTSPDGLVARNVPIDQVQVIEKEGDE